MKNSDDKSKQNSKIVGWLCLVIGVLLAIVIIGGIFFKGNTLSDAFPSFIISLCAVGSGIFVLSKANKQN